MEHLVVPTFVLDETGRVIIWNRSCERLTGISAGDVIGTKDHWQGFYTEERPCLADLVIGNAAEEIADLYSVDCSSDPARGIFSAENWCHLPVVGGQRYLAIDAGPIKDEDGRLIAVVETLRDITVQKMAQEKLEVLARQDPLTGIANRRMFDEYLETEWLASTAVGHSMALLMMDIDHFKAYNDTLGHLAGDSCLQRIAHLVTNETRRDCDMCARYGGEEFAIILPRTNLAGAVAVAKRISMAVALAAIPNPGAGRGAKLTLSIGVSAFDGDNRPNSPTDLLNAADLALYAAKQSGRACVCTPHQTLAA
ncbi:sensor domain-containing diguanylate cyclase [Jiella mangrovi]|nr:diguanylate cyclase [Jiella mangrovi]